MRRLGLCLLFVFGLGLGPGLGTIALAEPPTTHEIIQTRPSGFWTSNRPAVGGAYRYRLLGIGLAVLLATGLMMWRVIKRANDSRRSRP
jgi:hypothetical protein